MNTHADKTKEHKSQSVANAVSQKQCSGKSSYQIVDNRSKTIAQRELKKIANSSPKVAQLRALQEMANTGPKVSQLKGIINPQAKQTARLPVISKSVTRSPSGMIVQREMIDNTLVVLENGYPCFKIEGKKYHINYMDPKHVTCDTEGRTHYYFKGSGKSIKDAVGPGKKKKNKKVVKFKFSDLPTSVQNFIKNKWTDIFLATEKGFIEP